jgi:hypothetical protein
MLAHLRVRRNKFDADIPVSRFSDPDNVALGEEVGLDLQENRLHCRHKLNLEGFGRHVGVTRVSK